MVAIVKNNPAPAVTTCVVTPADMLKSAIQHGKALHTQALTFVYASAAWMLTVSHFKSSKDDGYMSRADAKEYIGKQLQEQTGVKNRMLYNYLSPADNLVSALTGSTKMFAPIIQQLGLAKTPDDMVKIIHGWVDNTKGRKIASLNDLHEALGYAAKKTEKPAPLTSAKAVDQVTNIMARIEEKLGGKLQESKVGAAIIEKVRSKGSFVAEQIKAITEESELKMIEAAIKEQRKTLSRLSDEAKKAAKDAGKGSTVAEAVKTGRGKSNTRRASV